MKVLVCCEFSGRVRNAFASLGHDAWSCDLQDSETPGNHIRADFRSVVQDTWDMVGYHYECRVMANSGVRWLFERPERWDELEEAVEIFNLTLRDTRPGWSENSVQHFYAAMDVDREYDQLVHPWQFGDPFFKPTCLWLRGLPNLRPTNILSKPKPRTPEHKSWSQVYQCWKFVDCPDPDLRRRNNRARTYPGIANAMATQWGSDAFLT